MFHELTKMKELISKCKNCLGCERLMDPEFKGVYRCENATEEINTTTKK